MFAPRIRIPLASVWVAAALLAGVGCDAGDPDCSCTPRQIDFGTIQAVDDTLEATFTVENSGDGDRLSWFIEARPEFGLSVRERGLYVLDQGEELTYTLVFAPQDSITPQTVDYVVGLGDCSISVALGAYDAIAPGACCLPDGSCQDGVLPGVCENDLGGIFQGEGTLCADVSCPQPPPPVCWASTDSIGTTFTIAELQSGVTTKRDSVTVRNDGGTDLVGSVRTVSCQGVVLQALEGMEPGAAGGLTYTIAAGDSAMFEVVMSVSANCTLLLDSNAPEGSRCGSIRVTAPLVTGTVQRARY